jgi:hypothetical protein
MIHRTQLRSAAFVAVFSFLCLATAQQQRPILGVDDRAATYVGLAIDIDVLSNDGGTDSSGNPNISLVSVGNPTNGVTQIVGSRVRYTPNAGFTGNDTFTYVLRDSANNTSTATVRVNVMATEDTSATTRIFSSRQAPAGSSDEAPTGVLVDGQGNLIVFGRTQGANADWRVSKFSPSGSLLWTQTFNGTANRNDGPMAGVLDASGAVIVTGYTDSLATGGDMATVKWSASGAREWVALYDGGFTGVESGQDIVIDASGNTYVTGYGAASNALGSRSDIITVSYNAAGAQRWVARFDNGNSEDAGVSLDIAPDASVVNVVGHSGEVGRRDLVAVAYNAADGTQVFEATLDGGFNRDDSAVKFIFDGQGNGFVLANGYNAAGNTDMLVVKANSSGVVQWVNRYNGPANRNDVANDFALDANGNVYVSGLSQSPGLGFLAVVRRVNADGTSGWVQNINSAGSRSDFGVAIAVDGQNAVYATAEAVETDRDSDFVTVKFDANGNQIWRRRDNGAANGADVPTGIAVSGANVYLAGLSLNTSGIYELQAVRYQQATTFDVLPSSYTVTRGVEIGQNDVTKIQQDDGVEATVQQRFQFAPTLANTELQAVLNISGGAVTSAVLEVQVRANSLPFGDPSCRQEVALRDVNTNQFVVVDSRKPTSTEQTVTVTLDAAQRQRFISSDGRVEVAVRVFHLAPLLSAWNMNIDRVRLTVGR